MTDRSHASGPESTSNLDPQLWESLYSEYGVQGIRYAHSLLHSMPDADEVVQDAFCRLLTSNKWNEGYEPESRFAPVFFRTVRNLSIDLIRKQKRRRTTPLDQIDQVPEPMSGDHGTEQEDLDKLQALIDELPERWRDALRLRVDGELSYNEIAEVLDCTQSQVRSWIYRARKTLMEQSIKIGLIETMNHERVAVTDAGVTDDHLS